MRVAPIRTLQNYEKKDRITNSGLLFPQIEFSQLLKMWKAIVITAVLCVFATERSFAQPFWSIGPKFGKTLGDNGGFTWGFEASYFPQQVGPLWGFTCDLTFWKDHSSLHCGIEGEEGLGVDVGPTLFYSKGTFNIGLSAIPWFGAFIYGYYEFAWPFGLTPFQSYGGYLKIPIGVTIN
jgi:hypothetical protein